MRHMKLIQLQYFQVACRFNNISKAAEELHISQPSISTAIKGLEMEFGANLFYRHNNHLELTIEGRFFLEKAAAILHQTELLSQQMKDMGDNKNLIKMGIPPMIGAFLFPKMFRAFKKLYPDIRMETTENGSIKLRTLVGDDSIDLAIIITNDLPKDYFNIINILSTRLVFCVAKGHHFADRKSIDMKSLQAEPLIMFKPDSYNNIALRKRFADADIEPDVLLYSSQLWTIKEFLRSGKVSTFMFEEIIRMDPELVGIPLDDPINLDIGLIWRKNKHIYSDVSKFIKFTESYGYL
jgi:DNA-binding transcriptional LysR family regulator